MAEEHEEEVEDRGRREVEGVIVLGEDVSRKVGPRSTYWGGAAAPKGRRSPTGLLTAAAGGEEEQPEGPASATAPKVEREPNKRRGHVAVEGFAAPYAQDVAALRLPNHTSWSSFRE